MVVSGFEPVKALYSRAKLMGKNYFTKGLIVLQFGLAIFLIIGTIAVYSQMNFLLHADMGYDGKNLVRIGLPYGKSRNTLAGLFKNELSGQASIESIAPKNGGRIMTEVRTNGKHISIDNNKIDGSFLPTFKIPILSGRNFSPAFPSDSTQAAIVNESFVKEAGWSNNEAVGKFINFLEGTGKLTIIGVIREYHFASLKEKITPQLFSMDSSSRYGEIWVRIKPDNIPKTLALLEHTYKRLVPLFPYDYQFMENINALNYETEAKWKQIIGIAAGLFIFISCIGLFGLVLLSIEQRTKEIGIRKVLGAVISRIVILISKDFIRLIGIAIVIAIPLAYYAVYEWLQHFPYRISIGAWIFVLAGGLALAIALITISLQAVKAAISNPVKSLRSE
jgi:putative ABC transport system permease protein